MKYLFYLIILFSISFVHFAAFAQEEIEVMEEERILELSNINAIQLLEGQKENVALIQQVGNQNTASVFQSPSGLQSGNFAQILQNGNNNSSIINQLGSNLTVRSAQSGNNNSATINTSGDNINVTTNQTGNRNSINTNIENSGFASRFVLLEQNGNNNQINFDFLNSTIFSSDFSGESVRISQTGNQQGINLRFDETSSPVEITQRPGAGGQGMQVNITTSAFPVR